MTDEIDVTEAPSPFKPKVRHKRRKRQAAKVVTPFKAEFAGLTPVECCANCKPDRCVISGTNLCAHPNKGGLQSALYAEQSTFSRYQRAKKALAQQKVDRTPT
jgi:hypothetical protein